MSLKNYSIHPFLCLCLCDDKVFVGPKELEPIWRGIRMETAQMLYRLMVALTVNDNHINQLHQRESSFQYQALCVSAQPFTKKRIAFDCRAISRRNAYRRVAKPPAHRLYTISETFNGLCNKYSSLKQTKKVYLARVCSDQTRRGTHQSISDHWNIKFSPEQDSCWLAIRHNFNFNSIVFYKN